MPDGTLFSTTPTPAASADAALSPKAGGAGSVGRYMDVRPSGVAWLGDVPGHWQIKRLKHLCTRSALYGANESAESYQGDGVRFLRTSDINDDGRLASAETSAVYLDPALVKDYMLSDGDLLLSRSGTLGRSFIYNAKMHGSCAYAGYLVRFVLRKELDSRFVFYFTKTRPFEQWVQLTAIAATIGNVNGQKFANMELPFPPLSEQQAIAGWLDERTRRIDDLIRAKRRLIALLAEQRTALISHAVTKGLYPHAPMKPSGIDWLGDVPGHWEVKRIKHLLHAMIDTEHKTVAFYPDGEYLVVRTTNVRDGRLVMEGAKFTDEDGFREWTRRGQPQPGDILFTREAPAGHACRVPTDRPVCIGQRMVLFRVRRELLDDRFGVYSIYSGIADEFIKSASQGSTVAHFNMSDIGNIPMLLPPLAEQHRISDALDVVSTKFDALTTATETAIARLTEYRQALISAAVTGKINVCVPEGMHTPGHGGTR